MNSLTNISGTVRRIAFALTVLSSLVLSVAAQKVDPQDQGKFYGDPGFRGEPINLNVVNADIRDILSYITDQYGINFVIDKSVKEVPVTVKVNDVPWNLALDSVLQAQELGVQVTGTILRVADNKTLAAEGELYRERMNNQLDTSQMYTEFVRLNYAAHRAPFRVTPAAVIHCRRVPAAAAAVEQAPAQAVAAAIREFLASSRSACRDAARSRLMVAATR